MKAPFPWFGGKSRVADVVWDGLGDVENYVEPFAGSLAVLLERPQWHKHNLETVNDLDAYLANFWRALAAAPDEVARYANWPVNEVDLTARHLWLVNSGAERLAKLQGDPDFYDAKVAGWWVWGICSWIGSAWCDGEGPWRTVDGQLVDVRQLPNLGTSGRGVNRKLPHLGTSGQGVNRKLPHLGDAGRGVNRQPPHLGDAGRGVNRQPPHLGDAGQGVNRKLPHLGDAGRGVKRQTQDLHEYMRALADRLRRVRVCCGDWSRVVTDGALAHGSTVGVFLDPPYEQDLRDAGCYNVDSVGLSASVREWCIANGDDPRLRIVLAGYEDEHAGKLPGWTVHAYSAKGSYATTASAGKNLNRHRERLWFSPACNLINGARQAKLELVLAP